MKHILLALSLLPMGLMAQKLSVSDTVWVNDEMDKVKQAQATRYGIVQEMDTVAHIATFHYFDRETNRKDIIRRVAVKEKDGKLRTRLISEILLYPDGATQEELVITNAENEEGKEPRTYARKIFYPDGALQYEETMNEKGEHECVYYKPNGKIDKNPKEQIPLYQTMPAYPGGTKALIEFLSKNVKYPVEAKRDGIQGRVLVKFMVDRDGAIAKVKVARSGGDKSLDREAVRVIKAMPDWKPGTVRGNPVNVTYTVPVNFKLN